MEKIVKNYLSKIGRKGGKVSRRQLSTESAKNMVRVREARRAFRKFYTQCFWSYDESYVITLRDVPWVVSQLRKNGNHSAWKVAESLCR